MSDKVQCLHCLLVKTLADWNVEAKAKTEAAGQVPDAELLAALRGEQIGAFVGQILGSISSDDEAAHFVGNYNTAFMQAVAFETGKRSMN
jgi:hypothetical protein